MLRVWQEAMETLLDDFMPTLMAATFESLGKDRDNEVVKELKASLRATEVGVPVNTHTH